MRVDQHPVVVIEREDGTERPYLWAESQRNSLEYAGLRLQWMPMVHHLLFVSAPGTAPGRFSDHTTLATQQYGESLVIANSEGVVYRVTMFPGQSFVDAYLALPEGPYPRLGGEALYLVIEEGDDGNRVLVRKMNGPGEKNAFGYEGISFLWTAAPLSALIVVKNDDPGTYRPLIGFGQSAVVQNEAGTAFRVTALPSMEEAFQYARERRESREGARPPN